MVGSSSGSTGIRVFVHTAVDGYAWQGVPPALAQSLQACLDAAGTFPGGAQARGPQAAGGVIRCSLSGVGGTAVYRYHRRIAGDFRGRDSHYVAFAFFPAESGTFDLGKVWNAPALRAPADGGFDSLSLRPGEWEADSDAISSGADASPVAENRSFALRGPDAAERISEAFQSNLYGVGALKCALFEETAGALAGEFVYEVFPEVFAEKAARAAFEAVPPYSGVAKKRALDAWGEAVSALEKKAVRLSSLPAMRRLATSARGAFNRVAVPVEKPARRAETGVSFDAFSPSARTSASHPAASSGMRPAPQPHEWGGHREVPDPSARCSRRRSFLSLVVTFFACFLIFFALIAGCCWRFKIDLFSGFLRSGESQGSGGPAPAEKPPTDVPMPQPKTEPSSPTGKDAEVKVGGASHPGEPQGIGGLPSAAAARPEASPPPDTPSEGASITLGATAEREEINAVERSIDAMKTDLDSAEAAKYAKAKLGAAETARSDAARLRDKSRFPEAKAKIDEAKRLYDEALAAASAERAAAKAAEAVALAEAAKIREDWDAVLARADEALRYQSANASALALKREAEAAKRKIAEAERKAREEAERKAAQGGASRPGEPQGGGGLQSAVGANGGQETAAPLVKAEDGRARSPSAPQRDGGLPSADMVPPLHISKDEILKLRGNAVDAVKALGPLAPPAYDKTFFSKKNDLYVKLAQDGDAADYSELWLAYSAVTNESAPIRIALNIARNLKKGIRKSDIPKNCKNHFNTGVEQLEDVEAFLKLNPKRKGGRDQHLDLLFKAEKNLQTVQSAIDQKKNQEEAAKTRRKEFKRRRTILKEKTDAWTSGGWWGSSELYKRAEEAGWRKPKDFEKRMLESMDFQDAMKQARIWLNSDPVKGRTVKEKWYSPEDCLKQAKAHLDAADKIVSEALKQEKPLSPEPDHAED